MSVCNTTGASMNRKIWFRLVPQIMKQLIESLVLCRARFDTIMYQNSICIGDVTEFGLAESNSQYRIQIKTENNTKDIFIAKDNVLGFTVHFQ
jgi:hypothetical protein